MNLKRTVLALAVASVTAVPMIASAAGHGPDSAVYGSLRYGLQSVDNGVADRVSSLQNFGSRFGIKGETDLGNGMTAFGKWEAHMFGAALRDFQIGIKGDFGQLYMGDAIGHTFDTFMTTDNSWWYGGSRKLTGGVSSNAITYMGGAGAVKFGLTANLKSSATSGSQTIGATGAATAVAATAEDSDALDSTEAAVSFDAGPVNIALGMTKAASADDAVIGVTVKGSASGFGYAFDYQKQDKASSMQLEGTFGSFLAQYGSSDTGATGADTPTALVLSYTQNIGPKTLIWYEMSSTNTGVSGAKASNTIAAVLKYEIL